MREGEREKRLEYKTVKVRESDDIIKQGPKQRSFTRRVAAAQHRHDLIPLFPRLLTRGGGQEPVCMGGRQEC